jgi:hypothetical protein
VAIFSLRHTWLGKSHEKYKAGVAQDHANYITRESSCSKVIGKRAPLQRHGLKAWLDRQETDDRKNARIIDKVMVALPIELTRAQREELVREYCERATEGRASWVAAIHDQGKDAHNPHAHIIFRDRDKETGKRVMMTTERGSTERLREQWEVTTNKALERAGLEIRIDRRTLEAQGIDRSPLIHFETGKSRKPVEKPERKNPFDRESSDRPKEKRRATAKSPALDWSERGGMVAQQWSATKKVKEGHERRRREAHERENDGPQSGMTGRSR